jgi:hypothetical protein
VVYPRRCPVCSAPGGFHDYGVHADVRRQIAEAAPVTPDEPGEDGGVVTIRTDDRL